MITIAKKISHPTSEQSRCVRPDSAHGAKVLSPNRLRFTKFLMESCVSIDNHFSCICQRLDLESSVAKCTAHELMCFMRTCEDLGISVACHFADGRSNFLAVPKYIKKATLQELLARANQVKLRQVKQNMREPKKEAGSNKETINSDLQQQSQRTTLLSLNINCSGNSWLFAIIDFVNGIKNFFLRTKATPRHTGMSEFLGS